MKLVTFLADGVERIGAAVGDRLFDLAGVVEDRDPRRPMIGLLEGGPEALAQVARWLADRQAEGAAGDHGLGDVALLAPIPRPGKIVAIGLNYLDHVAEVGGTIADKPRIVAKLPSSVTGPGSIVRIPPGVTRLDYEVELGAVIGRTARHVAEADALGFVAGYTILNDLSARELQFDIAPPQTTFAKSMDGYCPMGPWIVTADALPDPQRLPLRCRLNGELMQDGNTRDMIAGVAAIVAYASQFMTLEPGDVIATGTPAGVGMSKKPPRYLRPGDRLALEIDGIGTLAHAIG